MTISLNPQPDQFASGPEWTVARYGSLIVFTYQHGDGPAVSDDIQYPTAEDAEADFASHLMDEPDALEI